MEDLPFVTLASWNLSYDCDTVKKIIFFCSLRALEHKERFSLQPSMRSELMFISFFSFSQNEWLEFQLCCSFILINDSLQPAHESVFKCLCMRLWDVWLYALRLTLAGKSSLRITPALTFDPIRSDQSCPGRVGELGEHRRLRYHDWFTYCFTQQPCYRPFSSMEQTWVLIRRMILTRMFK